MKSIVYSLVFVLVTFFAVQASGSEVHSTPRIYPHTHSMGPGEFYRDAWGRPYRPIIRPYSEQPHIHIIPRRRSPEPLPRWSPWPEFHRTPGQGGQGKGPLFRYYYGPHGWGFRIGPNVVR